MYVSMHFSPQSRGASTDLATVDMVVQQAIAADAAGVAALSLTEHHLGGFNTYCDPFLLGTHLAGALTQAYVAINIVQVPLRHPVQIAEHCNILDLLTRGRCIVTLAPGSIRQIELDAYGVRLEERHARLRQAIDALFRVWGWADGDEPVDVATDYAVGRVAGRISPASFRQPHPLVARATATPETIVETARAGLPVMLFKSDPALAALYRHELAGAGHDDETVAECLRWLGFYDMVTLAATEREATRRREEYLRSGGGGPIVTAANEGSQAWIDTWKERERERVQITVPLTPEMLVERILAYNEDHGFEHTTVALSYVPDDHQHNQEMLRMFLEEVLPHVDPQPLPGPARTVLPR